jgi:predicted RNA-binding protein YlqC (UPF0109 family)
MKEAVQRIIKSLVGNPDAVQVLETGDGKTIRYEVTVGEGDIGRVIGREGRTVKAVRSILFHAGQKQGKRYQVDILD